MTFHHIKKIIMNCQYLLSLTVLLLGQLVASQTSIAAKSFVNVGTFSGYGLYSFEFKASSMLVSFGYVPAPTLDYSKFVRLASRAYFENEYELNVGGGDVNFVLYNEGTTSETYTTLQVTRVFKYMSRNDWYSPKIPSSRLEMYTHPGYKQPNGYKLRITTSDKMSLKIISSPTIPSTVLEPTSGFTSFSRETILPDKPDAYQYFIYLRCDETGTKVCSPSVLLENNVQPKVDGKAGAIAGAVVGSLLGVVCCFCIWIIVVVVIVLILRRASKQNNNTQA